MTPEVPLAQRQCRERRKGERLSAAEARNLREQVPAWRITGKTLWRTVKAKDFAAAMQLAQKVGRIAEGEHHHPDLHLTRYKRLRIVLSTHSVGGLSENDFIVAAKVDELAS